MLLSHWLRRLSASIRSAHSQNTCRRNARDRAGQSSPNTRAVSRSAESLEDRLLLTADFGDAPSPYPTLTASHEAVGPQLGALRDTESGGLPSPTANGDDEQNESDEDGVDFGLLLAGTTNATVIVNVQDAPSGAVLNAWFDFNRDGSWGGANEHVFANQPVSNGSNKLRFAIPGSAQQGETFARFRLNTTGSLGPDGFASDGEIEDYQVTIDSLAGHRLYSEATIIDDDVYSRTFSRFTVGDLDSDGDADLVYFGDGSRSVALYYNDGQGEYSRVDVDVPGFGFEKGVEIVDMDADGDKDIVLFGGGGGVTILTNDGSASFTALPLNLSFIQGGNIGDMTGDGLVDIIAHDFVDVFMLTNLGNMSFSTTRVGSHSNVVKTAIGDLDVDGDIDIASVGGFEISVFRNDGSGQLTREVLAIPSSTSYHAVEIDDVDDDGDHDIIAQADGFFSSGVFLYENGTGGLQDPQQIALGENHTYIEVADVDGDGHRDILTGHPVSGDSEGANVWFGRGANSFERREFVAPPFYVTQYPHAVIPVDVDGDSDIDLMVHDGMRIVWFENRIPGITVTGPSEIDIDESGGSENVEVSMSIQPGANVIVDVELVDGTEATISESQLVFTPSNWNQPQTITISGIEDLLVDGDQQTVLRFSVGDGSDSLFVDFAEDREVPVTIRDTTPFFKIDFDSDTVNEAAGAVTATVSRERTDISSDQSVNLIGDDPVAVFPASVSIPANETSTTFTITLIDDLFVEADAVVQLQASAPGFAESSAILTVEDDDVAAFSVTESGGSTVVDEAGLTDSFLVVLDSRPQSDVVVEVVSDSQEDIDLDRTSLTFTPDDWNIAQSVTVSADVDQLVEGNESGQIRVRIGQSSDVFFRNLPFQIVSVDIEDDDVAGFTISESGGDTGVGESGSSDSFTVVLTGQPLSPVRVTVESTDTDETTIDVSELIFTGENWDQPQTVTVTGIDDEINDGTQSVDVRLAIDPAESNDLFDGVSSQTVSVDVDGLPSLDELANVTALEDAANIIVDLTGISAGGSDAQPIRVTAAISDPSLATVSVAYADPAVIGELTIDPQLDATGEAVIEVTVEDGGLDANLSTTDDNQFFTQRFEFRLTPVNDEPVVAVPGAITVEEDERFSFELAATGTFLVTDVDASTLRATVSVSNGVLIVPDNVFGLSIDGTRTGDDSLTFLGSQVAINRALNRLIYEPNADFTGSDTLSLTVNDRGLSGSGGALEASDTVGITVLNDDDPPRNEVPGAQTTAEDTSLVFDETRRIAVSDVDAPAGGLHVSLTATNGLLDLSTTSGLSFTAGGDGTAAMTFTGQIASINTALDGLEFSPTANFNGAAEILIETLDPAVGASSTDSDRIEITVSAVNDEPENSLPSGPVSTQEDTPLVFSGGDLISISDAADGDQGSMQVALLVTGGLLELSGTGDLDFSIGSGRDQLMRFSGTVANVNAALDGLTFIPTRDFSGTVELRIVTSDLGNTGDGPELLDRDELTINVTAVDDAPTGQPDLFFVRVGETLSTSDALGTTTDTTGDNGVLANDSDPDTDQDQLTATIETGPAFAASFSLESDGTFSYRTEMPLVEDTFTYRVTDGSTPSGPVTTTIRVNHAPVVTAATFTLAEGTDAGSSLGQVQATDLNTNDLLRYEIVEGNTGGAFSINNETGQLSVLNSSALNFETNPVFELTVRVTDNAPEFVRSSTEQTIRVELSDVSENLEIGEDDWESDGLTLLRDGDRIRIVRTDTDTDVVSAEAGTIQEILVEGRTGIPDRLTVDFSGGNPIIGSLSFGGRDGLHDELILTGGTFDSVTHQFDGGQVGQLQLENGSVSTIIYSGLELTSDHLTTDLREFEFGSSRNVITISEAGTGFSQLDVRGEGESTIFANSDVIDVSLGGGNDVLDTPEDYVRSLNVDAGTGDDVIRTGAGNDRIFAGLGRDLVRAGAGNDTAYGGAGKDTMFGGEGEDVLLGNGGVGQLLSGGPGNDVIVGGSTGDRVVESTRGDAVLATDFIQTPETGRDILIGIELATIFGDASANRLDARAFNPVGLRGVALYGIDGDDHLQGSPGVDLLIGGRGRDLLQGFEGSDFLLGSADPDRLEGGGGNDVLRGQGSNDLMLGGNGNDVMDGGGGIDTVLEFATPDGNLLATTTQLSGRGNDTLLDVQRLLLEAGDGDNLIDVSNFQVAGSFVRINAAAGNDRIFGSPGPDVIFAGDGDDLVLAGGGNDVVYGGDGDDALAGGGGNDHLFGNGGRDTGVGGAGNDILQGGANPDVLIGGDGIDRVDGDGATDLLAGGDGTGVDTGDNLVGEEAEIDETFDENLLAELMDEV